MKPTERSFHKNTIAIILFITCILFKTKIDFESLPLGRDKNLYKYIVFGFLKLSFVYYMQDKARQKKMKWQYIPIHEHLRDTYFYRFLHSRLRKRCFWV